MSRTGLPEGIVTLVFTDIEGSTKLLHELGAEAYADALAEHRRLLREPSVATAASRSTPRATRSSTRSRTLARRSPRPRRAARRSARAGSTSASGIHTGTPHLGPEGYVGEDVHLGARIGAAGHGGQVLLSRGDAPVGGRSSEGRRSTSASTA